MKFLKLTFGLLFLTLVTSCVSSIPMNKQFYSNKKVGIILEVDSIGFFKSGSQGLLEMAITPGNRFTNKLIQLRNQFNYQETFKTEISNIMTSKNKEFQFLDQKIDYQSLDKFEKPKDGNKKYCEKDFRKFKSLHNVDEILYIKVKHGLWVYYQGVIVADKRGYALINTKIVDLEDNSFLQKETIELIAKIKRPWDDGDNLENSIHEVTKKSIDTLKTKF